MLLTIGLVYLLVATAFFGALAFAACQPIPQMTAADRTASELDHFTNPELTQAQLSHGLETATA
jgi:hypothetical protein